LAKNFFISSNGIFTFFDGDFTFTLLPCAEKIEPARDRRCSIKSWIQSPFSREKKEGGTK